MRGVKALSFAERGRARALHVLRDRIAQRLDRPPFKVYGDAVISDLAKEPPRNLRELGPRPGLRAFKNDRPH